MKPDKNVTKGYRRCRTVERTRELEYDGPLRDDFTHDFQTGDGRMRSGLVEFADVEMGGLPGSHHANRVELGGR